MRGLHIRRNGGGRGRHNFPKNDQKLFCTLSQRTLQGNSHLPPATALAYDRRDCLAAGEALRRSPSRPVHLSKNVGPGPAQIVHDDVEAKTTAAPPQSDGRAVAPPNAAAAERVAPARRVGLAPLVRLVIVSPAAATVGRASVRPAVVAVVLSPSNAADRAAALAAMVAPPRAAAVVEPPAGRGLPALALRLVMLVVTMPRRNPPAVAGVGVRGRPALHVIFLQRQSV